MMTFCNIHCLRKSSKIIVIPTTSVNVLWDAILPLSSTLTSIDRPFAKHKKIIVFRNTSVVFFNISNKRHTQAQPKEDQCFYCNNVLDIVHFVIQAGKLLLIITLNIGCRRKQCMAAPLLKRRLSTKQSYVPCFRELTLHC